MSLKQELIDQLNFMIGAIPEELQRIVSDALWLYFKSTMRFGCTSAQATACNHVIREMSRILKEEKYLLKLILKNIDNIDLDEACDMIDTLDELNDRTYKSYDKVLGDVETALELDNPSRTILKTENIDSLITNDTYKNQVLSLIKKEA